MSAVLFPEDEQPILRKLVTLRPYQEEAIAAAMEAWKGPQHRALLSLSTGLGKTIIFSALAARMGVPTLILAHREELLLQAKEKMLMVNPEADIGIVAGKLNLEQWGHQVTIAGVQTVVKPQRLAILKGDFASGGVVIMDEAHHAQADTYKTILEALPNVCLLGVTATPDRADGKDITDLFGEVIFERGLLWAIENNYLVDLKGIQVSTSINLDGVKTRMGDFAENELEARVNKPEHNQVVVDAYKKHAEGRQAICFAVTVRHAQEMASTFRAAGIASQVVSGDMASHLRHSALAAYDRGDCQVLCNVGVLTEGYDNPQTSCIIMARPTKSRGLYVQCVGRGTRLYPGKEDCLVLDLAGNAGRHSLTVQNLPRLAGGEYGRELPEDGATKRINEGVSLREVQYKAAGAVVEREISLLPKWEKVQDRFKLQLEKKADLWIAPRGDNRYIVGIVWPDGRKQTVTPQPVGLDWAQGIADEKARKIQTGEAKLVDKDAPWRSALASEKQRATLDKFHIRYLPGITKGEAADKLDSLFLKLAQKRAQKEAQG